MRYVLMAFVVALMPGCSSRYWPPTKPNASRAPILQDFGAIELTVGPVMGSGSAWVRVLDRKPYEWRGRFALGSPMQSFQAPVFVGGDEVLVPTLGGGMKLLDIKRGSVLWSKEYSVGVGAAPIVQDGHVFFAAMDGRLRRLRLDQGQEIWSVPLSAESSGSLVANKDALFVTADDQSLGAFDQRTGARRWTYKRPAPSGQSYWSLRGSGHPLINASGEVVYVGFSDGVFVALEASSGKTIWERDFDRAGRFKDADLPAQFAKGESVILLPLVDGDLLALRPTDGATLWTVPMGGGAAPLVDEASQTMYVIGVRGDVSKHSISDGSRVWSSNELNGELTGQLLGQPILVGQKYLAVLSASKGLYLFSAKDGSVVERRSVGPGAVAPMAFDGRFLLVLSGRNQLYRFLFSEG